ncbi:hypothetical protein C0J52_13213 [Blattella germanica]|nr:hypothetical protein C0J52_13213 [Blattella germanica]
MDENISNMSDSENIPLSTRGKERSLGRARSRARSRVPTTPPRRPGIPPQSIATPPKVILSETHLSDRENTGSTTERIKRSTDIGPSFKSSESTSSGISSHSSANNQQETDIKTLSYKLSDVKLENKDILAATRSRGDMQSERAKERKKPRQKESHEPMLFTKPKEMPTKKGDTGQRIRLNANYFKLPTVTNWCLNQYRVDFQPQEDRNAVKSSILKEHKHELDGGYIFDGTVLYTPYKYQRDVGRYYFDAQSRQRINEYKLELWPGYITSIRQHEQELLLCTEITHKKYEIKIKYPIQPMLISMPKQRDRKRGQDTRIYLVPELCRMTGLTDEMRSNFDLMKILAESTRLGPSQRMERLQNFNRRLHTNELVMKELKSWQMSLSETLISIPGRILPREKVILGIKEGEDMPIKSKPMLSSAPVDSWVVILPRSLKYEVQQFVGQLRRSAAQMEWRLSDPTFRELAEDKTQNFVEALGHAIATCNPKFILVVLPTNRQDRYSAIKKKCCVECAVPTQVILKKNINSKNVPAIATKVAIQLNCKIGGAPWTVEIPMKGLMVVGFDVYHDSLQRGLSIGALVASLDKPMSRYFSAVSYHKNGEELSNELSANICTVRVPAPVQYAHKLAYLIGQALHKTPNSHLEEYLYFL